MVLWKKLDEYRPAGEHCTDAFVRWACGIAYRQTLAYLRERRRNHLTLSLDVLDQIAQERLNQDQLLEQRRRALRGCLEKLPDSDRQIIDAYYCCTRKTAAEVGTELGRPTNTILKAHHSHPPRTASLYRPRYFPRRRLAVPFRRTLRRAVMIPERPSGALQ